MIVRLMYELKRRGAICWWKGHDWGHSFRTDRDDVIESILSCDRCGRTDIMEIPRPAWNRKLQG